MSYYQRTEVFVAQVQLSAAQVRNLNATPVTIVPTPGAGLSIIPVFCLINLQWNANAYDAVTGAKDLVLRYTDSSGDIVIHAESNGFLGQSSNQIRVVYPSTTGAGPLIFNTPIADTPIVANILNGEIAAADMEANGDSPILISFYYRIIPMGF